MASKMKNFLSKISDKILGKILGKILNKISGRIFVIFLSLIFASCKSEDSQETKIRIVDLQGKSHPVITHTPELNVKALEMQGKKSDNFIEAKNQQNSALMQPPLIQTKPQQNIQASDYATVSSAMIQKTLQPNNSSNSQQPNPIVKIDNMQNQLGQNQPMVEYDLAKVEEDEKPELKPQKPAKKPVKKSGQKVVISKTNLKGLFVQVGSFSNSANAKEILTKMQKFHKGHVEIIDGEQKIYRVLLGPFPNKNKANEMVKKITSSGYEAVLMRNK